MAPSSSLVNQIHGSVLGVNFFPLTRLDTSMAISVNKLACVGKNGIS
jgi:hypothetical protein